MRLMVHLVAGFPSRAGFAAAAGALRNGGAEILEIQIPFSDPSADGPAITLASESALRSGFRTVDIFDYIRIARGAGFERIMVMTYANIPFRYGVEKYIKDMRAAGVEGLITPDLPLEDTEGYYRLALRHGIAPVPVAVAGMLPARLKMLRPYKKIYVSLRTGITGADTVISAAVKKFLRGLSGAGYEIYGGFGINKAGQIKALSPLVHAVVVGSYFTRTVQKAASEKKDIYAAVKSALGKLTGS
ncbi:MAG: tryptophan synthase subunit alpha [Candidatus Margulisbacteria bacterium]|jgi:tryptophan synthase alpha chain|nr:tryptophan synthase subunit alpha [Candidatus Margulisiibacteriota bacterium]